MATRKIRKPQKPRSTLPTNARTGGTPATPGMGTRPARGSYGGLRPRPVRNAGPQPRSTMPGTPNIGATGTMRPAAGTTPGTVGGQPITSNPAVGPQAHTPPPRLPSSISTDITAAESLALANAEADREIFRAALAYGDPATLQRLANPQLLGAFGISDISQYQNPNSALATIARNLQQGQTTLGQNQNATNTFFSGLHLDSRNKLGQEADRQRLQAFDEYQRALNEWNHVKAEALRDYTGTTRSTGAADVEAALEGEPEPTGLSEAEQAGEDQPDLPKAGGDSAPKGRRGRGRRPKKKKKKKKRKLRKGEFEA